jgi:hypothetical protein
MRIRALFDIAKVNLDPTLSTLQITSSQEVLYVGLMADMLLETFSLTVSMACQKEPGKRRRRERLYREVSLAALEYLPRSTEKA